MQNDLIHAWGLDRKLGYCAQASSWLEFYRIFLLSFVIYWDLSSKLQGDRTVKVGVVDEEYIVHLGVPTLGGFLDKNKVWNYCPFSSARNSTMKFLEIL